MNTPTPIESIFLTCLYKHVEYGLKVLPQEPIETNWGRFRIDCLVMPKNPPGLAFECDGRDFHQDKNRDNRRDAALLATKAVGGIWRLWGSTIFYNIESALYLISLLHPRLFSYRGLTNLEILFRNEEWGEPQFGPSGRGTIVWSKRADGMAVFAERSERERLNPEILWRDYVPPPKPIPPPVVAAEPEDQGAKILKFPNTPNEQPEPPPSTGA